MKERDGEREGKAKDFISRTKKQIERVDDKGSERERVKESERETESKRERDRE